MEKITVKLVEFNDGSLGLFPMPVTAAAVYNDGLTKLIHGFYGKTLNPNKDCITICEDLDSFYYTGLVDQYVYFYGATKICDAERLENVDRIKYASDTIYTNFADLVDIVFNGKTVDTNKDYTKELEKYVSLYTMADIDQLYDWINTHPRVVDIYEDYGIIIRNIANTYQKFIANIEDGRKQIADCIQFQNTTWFNKPHTFFDELLVNDRDKNTHINKEHMYNCLTLMYYTLQNRYDELVFDMCGIDADRYKYMQQIMRNIILH